MNLEYLLFFIIGGTFMTLHKYITNEVSARLGAILVTFPVGLLTAYFIVSEKNMSHYLKNYIKQVLFVILISLLYFYMFEKKVLEHKYILIVVSSMWVIFAGGEMLL